MATSRSNEGWEKVLAAIEADAARAAALLIADEAVAEAGISYDHASGGAADATQHGTASAEATPANWRLPANPDGTILELPNLDEMPPIPTELRERIERLRDRINALQRDLSKALAEARLAPRPVRMPTPEVSPGFVDRKL